MWVGFAHAIDLRTLPLGKFLVRIETPASFEQALTPQYLMDAWNAPSKMMGRIKDGGIRICDLLRQGQQFAGNLIIMVLAQGEVRNGRLRPHGPVPEQAAGNPDRLTTEVKRSEEHTSELQS